MRVATVAAALLLLTADASLAQTAGIFDAYEDGTRVRQLLVVHHDGPRKKPSSAAYASMAAARALVGVESSAFLKHSSIFERVAIKGSASATLVAGILAAEPGVRHVQVDALHAPLLTTVNDPAFDEQWYHTKVESSHAWDLIPDDNDPEVLIVIDTG